MAWTYYCDDDGITLQGETMEELAEEVMNHLSDEHDMQMTMDQAMEMVKQGAKRAA